ECSHSISAVTACTEKSSSVSSCACRPLPAAIDGWCFENSSRNASTVAANDGPCGGGGGAEQNAENNTATDRLMVTAGPVRMSFTVQILLQGPARLKPSRSTRPLG